MATIGRLVVQIGAYVCGLPGEWASQHVALKPATGGGGNMTLDNTSIASAQVVTITSFGWTESNA